MARRRTAARESTVRGRSRTSTPPAGYAAADSTAASAHPHGDGPQLGEEHAAVSGGPLRRARGSGAGGRWWIWLGRAVLWAFIVVIAVNGGRAAFVSFTQQPPPERPATGGGQFPTRAAAAYAQQFADVYLNYDEASAGTRADRLVSYLAEGADPQLGWNGAGTLRLEAAHVAGVDVRDEKHAVVDLAVLVNDDWMRLAVPVFASGEAMAVSGQPALLPPPPKATLPATSGTAEVDAAATKELERQLPGFFKAYASSDDADLERYLDQGVSVPGLSGTVRFASLREVIVPPGGQHRKITATVLWNVPSSERSGRSQGQRNNAPAGELEQTYELTVTKQNGNWYVQGIRGSTRQSGQ